MPLYEIQHHISLTSSQKDDLAIAITRIHSTKFLTPKMFVNVTYTDVSETRTYIGGKQRTGNHIKANVRSGPSRTQEDWNDLSRQIAAAWDDIVGKGLPKVRRAAPDPDTSLRSVILLGGLVGGLEAGFILPPAGGDVAWLQDNWEAFNRKADAGDEEFQEMVQEVKERGLLEGRSEKDDMKAAQKSMEEMLGWGDSA
ncbi:hypothetical protein LTR36_004331 [Oleoguttula mirabilis]|uniref:Tautomerase cis-CaaD-like domain-containing protein n=1 Tax=Oleoguttula mirabilis TaxID=1507867 RepID=A0AAV9JGL1_9PEZI|nr:hypothetical protein LTR36_004331 [Oleoguttula mirabilis]